MPSLPRATCPPSPYRSLPNSQANVHTHTHTFIQTHTQTETLRFSRKQSLVEREGDASKGSVWTVAVTAPPHPARLRLPWTNEAMISGVFQPSRHCSNSQSQRDFFFFLHSVLITSEFSQPPRWGSPYVCGLQLHSGNHRDSRVCQSNGEWHRTGCHSDSQNQ